MACETCNYKGFVEELSLQAGAVKTVIKQCRFCLDVTAYSKRIQINLGIKPKSQKGVGECQVIPFPRK